MATAPSDPRLLPPDTADPTVESGTRVICGTAEMQDFSVIMKIRKEQQMQ